MRITVNAYLRKHNANAPDGTLYLRVTLDRLHLYVNLFEYIKTKDWNLDQLRVKRSHPLYEKINDLIILEAGKIHGRIIAAKMKGMILTIEVLKKLLLNEVGDTPIRQLIKEYCEIKNVGKHRIMQYATTMNSWENLKLPSIIEKVTTQNMLLFFKEAKKTLMTNTLLAHKMRFQAIFNYAIELKLIVENPVSKINVGSWENKTDFLSIDEVNLIINSMGEFLEGEVMVAKMFLFQIFTGLRFGDVTSLKPSMIERENQQSYLNFSAKKTKVHDRNPLLPQAIELLPYVLNVKYSNQYYNRTLKDIAKKSGINKHVSSHLARHTFGTIAFNKGVDIVSVQHLMGHADIKTTQIYAKLMNTTKTKELNKWNDNENMTAAPE